MSAEQLDARTTEDGNGRYFYLQVRVLSLDARQAVVNVQLFLAIALRRHAPTDRLTTRNLAFL